MKDESRKLFFKAMCTLLYSWGGDTPQDAIWAANEMLDFYKNETGIDFEEDDFFNEEFANKMFELSK